MDTDPQEKYKLWAQVVMEGWSQRLLESITRADDQSFSEFIVTNNKTWTDQQSPQKHNDQQSRK